MIQIAPAHSSRKKTIFIFNSQIRNQNILCKLRHHFRIPRFINSSTFIHGSIYKPKQMLKFMHQSFINFIRSVFQKICINVKTFSLICPVSGRFFFIQSVYRLFRINVNYIEKAVCSAAVRRRTGILFKVKNKNVDFFRRRNKRTVFVFYFIASENSLLCIKNRIKFFCKYVKCFMKRGFTYV